MFMPMLWNGRNDFGFCDPFDMMDRAANSFFNDASIEPMRAMKTDVIEEEKDYKLEAEMPGFKKEEIHIDMTNGTITISADHEENKDEKDEKTGRYLRRERRVSSFKRSFRVSDDLKPEDIAAKYENGVLTLTVPKKEALPEKKEAAQIEIH